MEASGARENETMNGKILKMTDYPHGARVLLAMSGGVDSAVSAVRLTEAGFDVTGITMKNYCYGDMADTGKSCCSLDAIDDARAVCDRMGIRHMVVSTEELFGAEVFDNFVNEYRAARTPNPCVRCNSIVRFDTLWRYAVSLGITLVATGHYARVFRSNAGRFFVARPAYAAKDQSYFLSGVSGEMLSRVIFPLGEVAKPEVRARARDCGLPVADKPESQEVCFIPDGSLRGFLDGRVNLRSGPIEMADGEVVGRHAGLAVYTVGQRRGLGVALGEPQYVVRLDADRNAVVIGPEEALLEQDVSCRLGWVDAIVERKGSALRAQIRSRSAAADVASVRAEGDVLHVRFATPQRAVAPGQTLALYDGDVVVGAGVIERDV